MARRLPGLRRGDGSGQAANILKGADFLNAYIARQPIFNREQKISGYELFYRNSSGNAARIKDEDVATRKVLTDANTLFGLLELTNGRPAFITFTKNLILDDFVREADPDVVLVQIDSEKIRIDQRMEAKLRALKDAGYALVLKNYTGQRHLHDVMYLFDIIRVNFGRTTSPLQKSVRYNHGTPVTTFVADRLETYDDFYQAAQMGYHYFQGYYWGRPEMISIPIPPVAETAYGEILGILSQVRDSDVNWNDVKCAEIIRGHLLLSYLFLREMNAILPPSKTDIRDWDIRDAAHAARLMGPPGLRHWLWLAYMRHNNITGNDDIPRRAFVRGLFMEELSKNSALDVDADSGNVFLMGVLSMMEEIIGESPGYLLRGFPLQLLDRYRNAYDLLLKYARGYEDGDRLPDIRLSLDRKEVERKYKRCEENADTAISRMDTPI